MLCIVIVGTGNHAHGLAHLFSVNNTKDSTTLLVSKPSIQTIAEQYFLDTSARLVCWDKAMRLADVVILAIPASKLSQFVTRHKEDLVNKILVDPTNSPKRGHDLHSVLSPTAGGFQWVKALNDVGAVQALLTSPGSKSIVATAVCSPFPKAREILKAFIEDSLGLYVVVVPFRHLTNLQKRQSLVGKAWVWSMQLMLLIFALTEFYASLRYNIFKGYHWMHLPLQVTNKAICWTAITGFALTQLPGILARFTHSGRSLQRLPRWLRNALLARKELGLISLWFLFIHILMSLILFNRSYYSKFFLEKGEPNTTKMNSIGEASFLFAIIGAGFYVILGISSLPGIAMTHAQWSLVYGPIAWFALFCGTVHVLIMGVKGWTAVEKWPGGLPPITLTSTLIPMVIMVMKLVQMAYVRVTASSFSSSQKSFDEEVGSKPDFEDTRYTESLASRSDSGAIAIDDGTGHQSPEFLI